VAAELAAGHTGPDAHPRSRPEEVESAAVRRCLELASQAGGTAWIVHLSSGAGLREIREARNGGQKVLTETCPQYLTLTDEVYTTNGYEAAKYVCSPPVRSGKSKEALWKGVVGGEVDIISTDHCSYNFLGQKELGRGDFSRIPNGLPAIEHRPALLWTAGVAAGRIGPADMARLLSWNPAVAFGLYPRKGALEPGSDADVVVWDPGWHGRLTAQDMNMKTDYTPWEGLEVSGRAKAVFLRGVLCAREGRVTEPGRGRYLFRKKSLF
jgi:dihydropyrimidinase